MDRRPYLSLDDNGFLVNDCVTDIEIPWRESVREITDAYRHHFGKRLHSAYLRGSVARGTARPLISDIDTFAIVAGGIIDRDLRWQQANERLLKSLSYYGSDVELAIVSAEDLMTSRKPLTPFFFCIKNMSTCITGDDLTPLLPAFRPSLELAVHLPELQESIRRARSMLDSEEDPIRIQRICQWIMKRLVRSGFEMVIVDANAYTRDLEVCTDTFASYFPDQARSMRSAFAMALQPPEASRQAINVLDELGSWMLQRIAELPNPRLECGKRKDRARFRKPLIALARFAAGTTF